jgi:glycosyltransferase involved in cell wall biosynthesis
MRIAQVAPLYESVPPKFYGGTERVVSYLTEEFVSMGHDVTLFASGDSETAAELVPCCKEALRLDPGCVDPMVHHILMLERVLQAASRFDVIHFHCDYMHFPLSARMFTPSVTTLHGRLDLPDLVPLFQEFDSTPVISISNSQREPLPWLNWQATVYHGLPGDLYEFGPGPGNFLAFLGRISPEKGVENAIEIAKRADLDLCISAKVDRVDRDYFHESIEPLLKHPRVHFIGEMSDAEKNKFLGQATALLVPINWEEPFGLVMIEAMSCGTPVLAFRRGSVSEVIDDGQSGFIVDDVEGAVKAVEKVVTLDRRRCRRMFEQRFTARRMACDYVKAYARLLSGSGNGKTDKQAEKPADPETMTLG